MNTFLELEYGRGTGLGTSFAWIVQFLRQQCPSGSTFKLMSENQPSTSHSAENPVAQSMKTMTATMPLLLRVHLYPRCASRILASGSATNVVTIIQQLIVNAYMDQVNIDDMIAKNLEKVNRSSAKQGLPPAKVTQEHTCVIKAEEERKKLLRKLKEKIMKRDRRSPAKYYNTNAKPGSPASRQR